MKTTKFVDNLVKSLGDYMDDSEKFYKNKLFAVDSVKAMLSELDKPIQIFSVTKAFNMVSKDGYDVLININNNVVICPLTSDLYQIRYFYAKNQEKSWFSGIDPATQEKIRTKYLQYVSRLEDFFEITFREIITMDPN